ncbi:MAG: DNA gyrase subunit A [Saprospiraceae bacterium]|jgi:DNA gyrase subunit A|nr:DNA gyrase subunit A [Saprospiraceae bacterium]MBK8827892.1 DNA gyrase subunit A [Saprospiraceae bacterium]MBK8886157.1 DNA gyrase subunit A [Saprospiraceae bacterium]MBK9581164.1 DNA gyrase subunit A [Saprospiraceae bacterium]MBP6539717.1 DNA gyrase subunit A [Saprospiraceae bacterium]
MSNDQRIIPINIEDEMKSSYIDYSMSVIVARALPDVRDGLKPVHRRVLFGMSDLGLAYGRSHKKSARIVGEVLGKYHPHGDSSVYDAMVRMAQDWSLRYPLVDGQGNFGSMDGDSPAAMRYTEARLARISDEMLADINKNTVDFKLNFDDSLEEPTVLPARIPNLLINGASGIAVGMATNMLPHNLSEVIAGIKATVDNPDITIDELIEYVKAPDFPTGGTIYGYAGVKEALHTGRGKVIVRGKANIESGPGGKETIIITEIPYQVNKAGLVAKIAELVNDDKIDGISDLRDESDRNGLRIVVEVKRDAMASVVLSKLYKFTPLQTSYGVNNIALVNGRPKVLNLKDLITEFIKFRIEVIIRRTQYDLEKALERAHILEGILIALDNIDEVIRIIRQSKTVDEAKDGLMTSFALSEIQAKAILEMRLQRLVSLEIDKVREEYAEVLAKIEYYRSILASDQLQRDIIKQELDEINEKFGDKRRTDISYADDEISIEDLIPNEEVVITISHLGYIKRTKTDEFKQQSRGGKGSRGAKTRDTDFVEQMFIAHNHNYLLLFTEQGRCFWLRAFEIPEASKTSQGRVLQNILAIPSDDKVRAYIKIENLNDEEFINNNYIIFCTKKGMVKKTIVEAFSRPRTNGINAITINEGDQLLEAKLTNGTNEIIIANKAGRAIRFNEAKARPMGRGAAGVKAITLTDKNDEVVGMIAADPTKADFSIFVVSEKGNGKRSPLEDYRITNRGGKGVKTINITDKTGKLIAIKWVSEFDDLMITTVDGIIIRTPVSDIRLMGRATQGVKVIRINDKESIADVTVIRREEAIDEEE